MIDSWLQYRFDYLSLWAGLAFLISATIAYLLYLNDKITLREAFKIAAENPDSDVIANYVPWEIYSAVFLFCAIHCWTYTMRLSFLVTDKYFYLSNFLRLALYVLYMELYGYFDKIHHIEPIVKNKVLLLLVAVSSLIVGFIRPDEALYTGYAVWCILVMVNLISSSFKTSSKIKNRGFFIATLCIAANAIFKLVIFSLRYGGFRLLFNDENIITNVFYILFFISQCIPIFLTIFIWKYGKHEIGEEVFFFKGFYTPLLVIFMLISGFFVTELYTKNYIWQERENLLRVGESISNAIQTDTMTFDEDGKLREDSGQYEAIEKLFDTYMQYSNKIMAICSYWKQKDGRILVGPNSCRPEAGSIFSPWTQEDDNLNLIQDCFNYDKPMLHEYNAYRRGQNITDKSISVFVPIYTDYERRYTTNLFNHQAFAVLAVVTKDHIWKLGIINKRIDLLLALVFILGGPFIVYSVSVKRKEGFKLPFNTSKILPGIVVCYIIISSMLIAHFTEMNQTLEKERKFLRCADNKALFISSIFLKEYSRISEMAKEIAILKGFKSVKEFNEYVEERMGDLSNKVSLLSVGKDNQIHDYMNSGVAFDEEGCKIALKNMFKTKNTQIHCHYDDSGSGSTSNFVMIMIPLIYNDDNRVSEIFCYKGDFQKHIDKVLPTQYFMSDSIGFKIFDIEGHNNKTIACYPSSSSSSSFNAIYPLDFFNKTFGITIYPIGGNYVVTQKTYFIYLAFGIILAILVTLFILAAQKRQISLEEIVLQKSNSIKIQDENVRNITSNLPLVSFRLSVENGKIGRPLFLSAAMYDYSGYTSQAYLSGERNIFETLSPLDRDRIYNSIGNSISEYKPITEECQYSHADGRKFWVNFSGSPIADKDGVIRWFDGFVVDIQNRKDVEREILKNKDVLITKNNEFQAARQQAENMAKMADEANAMKDQFLANMSHEIRTPMNAILGMSNLLLTTKLSDEQKQYSEIVNTSTTSLLRLIEDILDISKLDSTVAIKLENVDFNLQDVVEETLTMLEVKANEKKIELNLFVDRNVPVCLIGDSGRLRQVIINLVNNAIKFTSVGGVSVKITQLEETANDVLLKVVISDTGVGIAKENISKLFKAFSQAEDSTRRKFGGTGLGLMISKQIVEMFGGQVGVESEFGHGSDFWFTSRFEKQQGVVAEKYKGNRVSGAKILVVDDYEITRQLLGGLLKDWGCKYTLAENALLALQQMNNAVEEKEPYQIVLLDSEMPVMDGNQFAELIKSNPRFSESRIIMMTRNGLYNAVDLEKYGLATSIQKPIRYMLLNKVMGDILGGKAANGPVEISEVKTLSDNEKKVSEKRILLVEDNKTNQVVALALLKKLGYKADVANDGSEGIKALAKCDYDLVFMDCQMPIIDGFEATKRIRNGETNVINPKVTIVAMTANAMSGDKERCLDAGMNDYLSKPVQLKLLKEMLDKYLA